MASRGGAQEQLAKRYFARSRFRAVRTWWIHPGPNWLLVTIAWRLADPLTRTRFRARAREALAARCDPDSRKADDVELDVRFSEGGA